MNNNANMTEITETKITRLMTVNGIETIVDKKQTIVNKQQYNLFKNHGVLNPLHKKEFTDKRKETNIEKYGVSHPLHVKEFKNKSIITKNINKLIQYCNIRNTNIKIDHIGRKFEIKKSLDRIIQVSKCDSNILNECIKILESHIPKKSPKHFLSAISTLKMNLN